jgi:hypothetical protein
LIQPQRVHQSRSFIFRFIQIGIALQQQPAQALQNILPTLPNNATNAKTIRRTIRPENTTRILKEKSIGAEYVGAHNGDVHFWQVIRWPLYSTLFATWCPQWGHLTDPDLSLEL